VYRNLLSVKETLEWIAERKNVSVPENCRELVERATHADYLRKRAAALGGFWIDLWRELFDDGAMKAQLAQSRLIYWARPYREALVNEWLPTRLGEGTITVAVQCLGSPLTGDEIRALPVPMRWLRGALQADKPIEVRDGRLKIGDFDCTYNRLGLLKTAT
jgi:hypothetical protein